VENFASSWLFKRTIRKVKWSRYSPGVAQRVGRGTALFFHDRGTRRGWVVSSTPWTHFTPGKDTVPILQQAGWAPRTVWTDGKSRRYWDSTPDRPVRSQSLYRLNYPAHIYKDLENLNGLQLVKKFPAFHGTRRFISALTSVRQMSLSWASPMQSIYPHTTSWRSILILCTHLRLGLPCGILPSGFPTNTLYIPLS